MGDEFSFSFFVVAARIHFPFCAGCAEKQYCLKRTMQDYQRKQHPIKDRCAIIMKRSTRKCTEHLNLPGQVEDKKEGMGKRTYFHNSHNLNNGEIGDDQQQQQ